MTYKVLLELELSTNSSEETNGSDDFFIMHRRLLLPFAPYPGLVIHCESLNERQVDAARKAQLKAELDGRTLPLGAASCTIERVSYFEGSREFIATAAQMYPTSKHVTDARDYVMIVYGFTQDYPSIG